MEIFFAVILQLATLYTSCCIYFMYPFTMLVYFLLLKVFISAKFHDCINWSTLPALGFVLVLLASMFNWKVYRMYFLYFYMNGSLFKCFFFHCLWCVMGPMLAPHMLEPPPPICLRQLWMCVWIRWMEASCKASWMPEKGTKSDI